MGGRGTGEMEGGAAEWSGHPFRDTVTAPLSTTHGWALAVLAPLALLRLAGVGLLMLAYIVLLLVKRSSAAAKHDVPFTSYGVVWDATRLGARAVLWLLGFQLRVDGEEIAIESFHEKMAPIIVSNHVRDPPTP